MRELIRRKLIEVLEKKRLNANKVARMLCKDNRRYNQLRVRIYQYLRGRNTLGVETLSEIFTALGIEITINYEQASTNINPAH